MWSVLRSLQQEPPSQVPKMLAQAFAHREQRFNISNDGQAAGGSSGLRLGLYADTFSARVQHRAVASLSEAELQTLWMRAFFRCPLFKLERAILGLATSAPKTTDDDIMQSDFDKAPVDPTHYDFGFDGVAMFRLMHREPTQAVFQWDPEIGRTFFGVEKTEAKVGVGADAALDAERAERAGQEVRLLFGSSICRVEPDSPSWTQTVLAPVVGLTFALHRVYARALVVSAGAQLLSDLEAREAT